MNKTAIVLVTLAAFVLGAAAGGIGTQAYERFLFFQGPGPGRPPLEDMIRKRLFRELGLDEAQKQAVSDILAQTRRDTQVIMRSVRPEIDARLERTGEAIRALLRPEQLARFEEMERERREMMDRLDRDGPDGPPFGSPPGPPPGADRP